MLIELSDFMPQYEIGQQELVDIHHYTYLIDMNSMAGVEASLKQRIHYVNSILVDHILFSTQKQANYEKMMSIEDFKKSKKFFKYFQNAFFSLQYLSDFIGLGFAEINPKEKEINSLTQTVFYTCDLMRQQANRQSFEFEKECINQMARSNYRKYIRCFDGGLSMGLKSRSISKLDSDIPIRNTIRCFIF